MRITKNPQERKEEIIRTALNLFLKKGYAHTAVSEIVKNLNVAQGTFYHYFKSKEDVLDAIVHTYITAVADEAASVVNDNDLDALQKLEQISYAQLRVNQRFNINLHSIKGVDIHERIIGQLVKEIVPMMAEVVRKGAAEGVFDVRYPLEYTEIFVVAANMLFDPGIFNWNKVELETRVDILIELMEATFGVSKGSFDFYKKLMTGGREIGPYHE